MQITVKSVSRLHLGFLDLTGDLGRSYGSIGVALENPRTVVSAFQSERLVIENGDREKILRIVRKFSEHYQVQAAARIRLLESIPDHSGFGSGTQLTLAVATALAKICCIDTDVKGLSAILGRGRRSGVGIAGFETGGFIIDAGRKNTATDSLDAPPTIIFRCDFPDDWRFVVVVPKTEKGLFGREEERAMGNLAYSTKISEEICRLTQLKLIPSLVEKDIEEFGSALTEIDLKTGMFFQEVQGGVYRGTVARSLVEFMIHAGAYGVGQSSWGPAIYGLVDEEGAPALAHQMRDFLFRTNLRGQVFVSRASNRGAEIGVRELEFDERASQEAV